MIVSALSGFKPTDLREHALELKERTKLARLALPCWFDGEYLVPSPSTQVNPPELYCPTCKIIYGQISTLEEEIQVLNDILIPGLRDAREKAIQAARFLESLFDSRRCIDVGLPLNPANDTKYEKEIRAYNGRAPPLITQSIPLSGRKGNGDLYYGGDILARKAVLEDLQTLLTRKLRGE